MFVFFLLFFFFKQKTAYEMRISDWSSDVCSSDLQVDAGDRLGYRMLDLKPRVHFEEIKALARRIGARDDQFDRAGAVITDRPRQRDAQIGRASCRERGCHYG